LNLDAPVTNPGWLSVGEGTAGSASGLCPQLLVRRQCRGGGAAGVNSSANKPSIQTKVKEFGVNGALQVIISCTRLKWEIALCKFPEFLLEL
jgi:hypothetical protein